MTAFRAGVSVCVLLGMLGGTASAVPDTFGTGGDQFTIDFVPISGATNPTSGYGIVNNDYRMGTFEITNDQWSKFKANLGVPVTGSDGGYSYDPRYPYYTGANGPTNGVSWYEAAQFVNWLNTSTGHQAAYKFTGTQGTADYTLATWGAAEADNVTNLYRHKDAKYYLPTENEWVKAAYWNGTSVQTYATKDGAIPWAGVNANYCYAIGRPWDVGSGVQELNGTYDMMGNVYEWLEGPPGGEYGASYSRGVRGGSCLSSGEFLASSYRSDYLAPSYENIFIGFRVASEVPEPASLGSLTLGGLVFLKRRRR